MGCSAMGPRPAGSRIELMPRNLTFILRATVMDGNEGSGGEGSARERSANGAKNRDGQTASEETSRTVAIVLGVATLGL